MRYPTIPVAVLLIVLVIPAIFANQIARHDPRLVNLSTRLTPPMWQEGGSKEHILGTDKAGRDILSRIIYGSRLELLFAAVTVVVSTIIGTALGLTAGRLNGWAGTAIMRLVNIAHGFSPFWGCWRSCPTC